VQQFVQFRSNLKPDLRGGQPDLSGGHLGIVGGRLGIIGWRGDFCRLVFAARSLISRGKFGSFLVSQLASAQSGQCQHHAVDRQL
jgi:hypothetical protein